MILTGKDVEISYKDNSSESSEENIHIQDVVYPHYHVYGYGDYFDAMNSDNNIYYHLDPRVENTIIVKGSNDGKNYTTLTAPAEYDYNETIVYMLNDYNYYKIEFDIYVLKRLSEYSDNSIRKEISYTQYNIVDGYDDYKYLEIDIDNYIDSRSDYFEVTVRDSVTDEIFTYEDCWYNFRTKKIYIEFNQNLPSENDLIIDVAADFLTPITFNPTTNVLASAHVLNFSEQVELLEYKCFGDENNHKKPSFRYATGTIQVYDISDFEIFREKLISGEKFEFSVKVGTHKIILDVLIEKIEESTNASGLLSQSLDFVVLDTEKYLF